MINKYPVLFGVVSLILILFLGVYNICKIENVTLLNIIVHIVYTLLLTMYMRWYSNLGESYDQATTNT